VNDLVTLRVLLSIVAEAKKLILLHGFDAGMMRFERSTSWTVTDMITSFCVWNGQLHGLIGLRVSGLCNSEFNPENFVLNLGACCTKLQFIVDSGPHSFFGMFMLMNDTCSYLISPVFNSLENLQTRCSWFWGIIDQIFCELVPR